ncbi:hypothetical protein HDU99_004638, partial [Rhizoclosmatium hyalinum]
FSANFRFSLSRATVLIATRSFESALVPTNTVAKDPRPTSAPTTKPSTCCWLLLLFVVVVVVVEEEEEGALVAEVGVEDIRVVFVDV